jgi:integrase
MGRRPNVRTTDRVLVRLVAPKRAGTFVLKWIERDGTQKQMSTGLPAKRTLRRAAEERRGQLEESLNATLPTGASLIHWDDFVSRYVAEHLSGLAVKTRKAFHLANSHFIEMVAPAELDAVTADSLSRFVAALRRRNVTETSVDTYQRTIEVALSWAKQVGMIELAPRLKRPRRARGVTKRARGRAPTREEIERMMAIASRVRPTDGPSFARLIDGLDRSGLRITEAIDELSWDWNSRFAVHLDGPYPYFKVLAESEKGHRDRLLPMAPDFADWLQETPQAQRRGRVFKMGLAASTVGKWIGAIGEAAGVVVSESGKHATAQDLRRAFGTRWSRRVKPAVLQQLMRHKSIETTMQYYVHLNAEELGAELAAALHGGACGGAPLPSPKREPLVIERHEPQNVVDA